MNKENSTLWQRSTVRMEFGEKKKREKNKKSRLNEAWGAWCIRKREIGSPLNNQILANYPKIWNSCSNAP